MCVFYSASSKIIALVVRVRIEYVLLVWALDWLSGELRPHFAQTWQRQMLRLFLISLFHSVLVYLF